jgi:hypothetical protein
VTTKAHRAPPCLQEKVLAGHKNSAGPANTPREKSDFRMSWPSLKLKKKKEKKRKEQK